MSAKELVLDGGLNEVRLNDAYDGEHVVLQINNSPVGRSSMMAMLDRNQQHLLMLYLQERLAR